MDKLHITESRLKINKENAHAVELLELYAKRGGYFVNYSDYEGKIGKVKGKVWYNTPTGIYCFILSPEHLRLTATMKVKFAQDRTHINILKMKGGGKWLDLDHYREKDLERDLKKLRLLVKSGIHRPSDRDSAPLFMRSALQRLDFFIEQDHSTHVQNYTSESVDNLRALDSFLQRAVLGRDTFLPDSKKIPQFHQFLKKNPNVFSLMQHAIDELTPILQTGYDDFPSFKIMAEEGHKFIVTTLTKLRDEIARAGAKVKEPDLLVFDKSVNIARTGAKMVENMAASGIWNITRSLGFWGKDQKIAGRDGVGSGAWAKLLRALGYDGAKDRGMGLIHPSEPEQTVFFDSTKVELVKTILNPFHAIKQLSKSESMIQNRKNENQQTNQILYTLLYDLRKLDALLQQSPPSSEKIYEVLKRGNILHLWRTLNLRFPPLRSDQINRAYKEFLDLQNEFEGAFLMARSKVRKLPHSTIWNTSDSPTTWPPEYQNFLSSEQLDQLRELIKQQKSLVSDLKMDLEQKAYKLRGREEKHKAGIEKSPVKKFVSKYTPPPFQPIM